VILIGVAVFARAGIPVDPDAPHARQWLVDELAKPEYQAARPTWFDLVTKAIRDWLGSLRLPDVAGTGSVFLIVAIVIAIALVATAFLVFGVPRLSRRARSGAVLDADDGRSADDLRAAAQAAARAGSWSEAVLERFRAITLGLRERTVVSIMPGTTAHEVAERAAPVFPEHADALRAAASAFDGVRYLGHAGTSVDYEQLSRLDDHLLRARPVVEAAVP
jgi:hypothetical protein